MLFLLYLAVLLRITVFRSDFGSHPLFADGVVIWVPFVNLFKTLQNSVGYFLYLFVGNLIWFVPFGLLVPLLTGTGSVTIFWAFLLSMTIEILQFVFGTGFTEVEDVILNTLGTAMGYVVYWWFHRIYQRRHGRNIF